MKTSHWGLLAVSAIALAACDVVRVPGGDHERQNTRVDIPEGAPGPPPPTVPVDDPWGENPDDEVVEIPVSDTTDPIVDPNTELDQPQLDPVDEAPETDPSIDEPESDPVDETDLSTPDPVIGETLDEENVGDESAAETAFFILSENDKPPSIFAFTNPEYLSMI